MLKAAILSMRGMLELRILRTEDSMKRILREGEKKAAYRRAIRLYRDLLVVIDRHDGGKLEAAE